MLSKTKGKSPKSKESRNDNLKDGKQVTKCETYRKKIHSLQKKLNRIQGKRKELESAHSNLVKKCDELENRDKINQEQIRKLEAEKQRREELAKLDKGLDLSKIDQINNNTTSDFTKISRYTYTDIIVQLALQYYCSGCSLRTVAKILKINAKYLFPALNIPNLPDYIVPSYSTISTWIQKYGLHTLNDKTCRSGERCRIVDESVSVNGEKLMNILDAPAENQGRALEYGDAAVSYISVEKSRTAEDVAKEMKMSIEKFGGKVDYFLGDGGKNLTKGAALAGYTYHIDCGHSIANALKSVYEKCEDFKEFFSVVGSTRHYSLTEYAYLMPPSMRSNSRFMNIGIWIFWAKNMNDNDFKMSKKERFMYSFLEKHAWIVDELYDVLSIANKILQILKNNGLCTSTADSCMKLVNQLRICGKRPKSVGDKIAAYLKNELSKMDDPSVAINISSDLIESLFGYIKDKMPKDKRSGFRHGILLLPLKMQCSADSLSRSGIKTALENTRMADIAVWENDTLKPSQVKARKKILSA